MESNLFNNLKRACPASFIALAAMVMMSSCSGAGGRKSFRFEEGMAWNTVYHITYESDADLRDSIICILDEIDNSLSPFNPNSTVSKINANSCLEADGHFANVYNESVRKHRQTGGAFDPTLGPVIRAWGFGQGHEVSADTLRIDSLLRVVGIEKTRLVISDGKAVLSKDFPETEFNFSALAKGYGVDCVAEMLERNGVENYLVEIGGEIRSKGVNKKGNPWSIGIDLPVMDAASGEMSDIVTVNDCALATSGNYRNYQQAQGGTFGHTISPSTGRPVLTDVASATVVAPSCMEADAIATVCMVVGKDKAIALCDSLNLGLLLVLNDLSVVRNAQMNALTVK